MKVKIFSKLDTLQDSIKIVSKKTGENLLRDLENGVIRDRHLIFT